jgi:hypothetical protein
MCMIEKDFCRLPFLVLELNKRWPRQKGTYTYPKCPRLWSGVEAGNTWDSYAIISRNAAQKEDVPHEARNQGTKRHCMLAVTER